MADGADVKLGAVYVEIAARAEKLSQELQNIARQAESGARNIEQQFARAKININTTLMQRSFSDVQKMHATLQGTLSKKLALNADMASISRTRNALEAVEAKLQGLQAASTSAGGPRGLGGMFAGFDMGIGSALAGMGAVLSAAFSIQKVGAFLGASFEKFETRETALKGVGQTIRSMGKEGEYTTGSILKMAEELQRFNKYATSTNDILDLSTFMLTFDNISEKTLPRATQVVIDLSKKMDTNLKGAAMAVGIALDNPAEGLLRLGRAGIKFTKDERDIIAGLVAAGDAAAAQEMIFDKLEKKIGGFARATTHDLDAYEGKIGEVFSKLQRGIGFIIHESLESLVHPIANLFTDVAPALDSTLTSMSALRERFESLAFNVESLGKKTNKTTDEEKLFKDSQDALLAEFPNYFKGLDASAVKYGDLMTAIIGAREKLDEYITSMIRAAIAQDKLADIVAIGRKSFEETLIIQEELRKIQEGNVAPEGAREAGGLGKASEMTRKEMLADIEIRRGAIAKYARDMADLRKIIADATESYMKEAPEGVVGPTKEMILKEPKPAPEALKTTLDAERELAAARDHLREQTMASELARERQLIDDKHVLKKRELEDALVMEKRAAENKYAQKREEIANEEKISIAKKEVLPEGTFNIKQETARIEFNAQMLKIDTDASDKKKKLAMDEVAEKLAFEEKYAGELKSFQDGLVDQQIHAYSLSLEDYRAYLDRKLQLEIDSLIARNKKIAEYNALNPSTPLKSFNVPEYKAAGEEGNREQTSTYEQSKQEKEIAKWEKNNKLLARGTTNAVGAISDAWGSMFDALFDRNQSFADATTYVWTNMVNQLIAQIARLAAQYVVLLGLKAAAGAAEPTGILGFIIKGFGGHEGGTFEGTPSGIRKMSSGGEYVVPPGFFNDSYPMMVESGERVRVSTASQAREQDRYSSDVAQKLDIINRNLLTTGMGRGRVEGKIAVEVAGNLRGQDIELSRRKAGRVYARIH